ncbi:MAG: rhodanese-related sulfurtransferase [Chlamydiales bacterium]
MKKNYQVLAYYHFVPIDDPLLEIKKHKKFFENKSSLGRIYISEEGINGQLSGESEDMEAYEAWLKEDERFSSMPVKIHPSDRQVFPRLTIKYRKQLVALDQKVNLAKRADKVSSTQWKAMLESGEYLILDVRNHYEWEIGHFEGAVLPPLNTFREFPSYADRLSEELDPKKTKIMMCCTGGIRCELFSALLIEKGFEKVYQLDGGILNYGLQEGSKHWKGKVFVFDDRLAVSIDGKETLPISKCHHCHLACDTYYNCANMDCNQLFICCPSCHEIYEGCCQKACQSASHRRPYSAGQGNTPFRRKHLIEK